MTKAQMRRNVRRGARLLDEEMPGWARKVRIRALDQSDGCDCVLGQMYTLYYRGRLHLGLSGDAAERHGFNLTTGNMFYKNGDSRFPVLDELWAEEIRARRKPKVAA